MDPNNRNCSGPATSARLRKLGAIRLRIKNPQKHFSRTSENSRYAKFALFRGGSSDLANAGRILLFPGSDDPRSSARP
jgi:hypothetical protein